MRRMKRVIAIAVVTIACAAGAVTIASQRSAAAMSNAAAKWLSSLEAEKRAKASFAFDSEERLRWHFIPNESHPRKGLTFKEMTDPQRELAHALLKTGLSARGHLTATAIVELEKVLVVMEGEKRRFPRDHEAYFVSVFGTPGDKAAWGWRFEGHHISLRFDVVGGSMTASSPAFFGTNPAEVRTDVPGAAPKGTRVLAAEEDTARALVDLLDPAQRAIAVIQPEAPTDILTMITPEVSPLSPAGIKITALTKSQRDALMKIIDVYATTVAPDIAAERMARVRKAGLDNITFAWAGSTEKGQKHYYRVQGPSFLIEYDNTQNNGNHIHSVWRDFNGDFGRDLLREHLKAVAH
jgi:hypothetical protein